MNARNTQAGGCLLASSTLGGVVVGLIYGEPALGFLIGTAAGVLLALLIWLVDRRRS